VDRLELLDLLQQARLTEYEALQGGGIEDDLEETGSDLIRAAHSVYGLRDRLRVKRIENLLNDGLIAMCWAVFVGFFALNISPICSFLFYPSFNLWMIRNTSCLYPIAMRQLNHYAEVTVVLICLCLYAVIIAFIWKSRAKVYLHTNIQTYVVFVLLLIFLAQSATFQN
jgi:hypothetical protein